MWKRQRSARDFAEEMESHLEIETDRLIAQGMRPDDARHAARKAFGNMTKQAEHFHDSRRSALVENFSRHVRYAVRGLLRRPAFAITAVITLAFGIGVNSALFTLLYSLLFRPPPVGEPASFVSVYRQVDDDGRPYSLEVQGRPSRLSWPDYLRLAQGTRNFEHLAVYDRHEFTLDIGDRPVTLFGELASCNYFATLRIPMTRGRAFREDECRAGSEGRVIVLSHALWQRRFGGDTAILGRTLNINRQQLTVIGVAAQGFAGLQFDAAEAWLPVTLYPVLQRNAARLFERDISWLVAVARLRPEGNADGAAAELTTLARAEDANWPGRASNIVVSAGKRLDDPDDRVNVMIAATGATILGGLILLMCCANVMNLLLARAAARRREIGIRLSLGASRRSLVAQLMVESAVLATVGAALGLVLAWWLPPLMRAAAPDQELNMVLSPDVWVLAATMGIAIGAAILFGLVPALQSTSMHLTAAMRNDTASNSRLGGTSRWRNAAVMAQVSVSALLLVTAAMFMRATQRSFKVDPGFAISNVSTVTVNLQQGDYDATRTRAFYGSLREQLAASTGVQSVATAEMIPLRGRATMPIVVPGASGDSAVFTTLMNTVSGEYFRTMEVPLLTGRVFGTDEMASPSPVIVSKSFADKAWPGADAINRIIRDNGRPLIVVGVVRDVQSVNVGVADGPYLYMPASRNFENGHLFVRSSLSQHELQSVAARISRELDASLVVTVTGLSEQLSRAIAPVALAGRIASGLGLVALLLAAVGVYGVIAFAVSQRSREIGIRMALGATERSVQSMVFVQGARVVGIGLAIGLVLAAASSQAIRSVLFGLSALDVVAFGGVALLLSVVAAVAVGIPATRAARVDPVASLRED